MGQGAASLAQLPITDLVVPLAVYAVGRKSFEVLIRAETTAEHALPLIFAKLPMEEHGWKYDRTDIHRARRLDGYPVWKLERAEP